LKFGIARQETLRVFLVGVATILAGFATVLTFSTAGLGSRQLPMSVLLDSALELDAPAGAERACAPNARDRAPHGEALKSSKARRVA